MLEKDQLLLQLIDSLSSDWAETKLNDKTTNRGFQLSEFTDRFGSKCSIQESSADGASIWFGVDKLRIQHFKAGEGWNDVVFPENTIEEHWVDNARMHLTQDMVKALLPQLARFAITGLLR